MGQWLFDEPVFQATMTDAERREAELFRNGVTPRNESKEDTTMTKTADQTIIANEQEGPMTETITNEPKENAVTKYNFRDDKARHAEIRAAAKLGRVKPIEVTSCIPGKTAANFTDDPDEVTLLGKAAAKFGMGGEFCTVSQAKKFGGTLDPDYEGHGWLVKYKPYTPKSGKNAGVTSQFETVVYPKAAFIWAAGEPAFDEQAEAERKAKAAKRAARRAEKALKEANAAAGIKTPPRRRRTVKKVEVIHEPAAPNADVAALTESLNAVMAQNAQLIAALTAALAK